jgi:hypothetical protein
MLRTIKKRNAIEALMVSGIATPLKRTIAQPAQPMKLVVPTKRVKMPNSLLDIFMKWMPKIIDDMINKTKNAAEK